MKNYLLMQLSEVISNPRGLAIYFVWVSLLVLLLHLLWVRMYDKNDAAKKRHWLVFGKLLLMQSLTIWIFATVVIPIPFAAKLFALLGCARYVYVRCLGFRLRTALVEGVASFIEFEIFVHSVTLGGYLRTTLEMNY